MTAIETWLQERQRDDPGGVRPLWCTHVEDTGFNLAAFAIAGQVVIVQQWDDRDDWEAYIQASLRNDAVITIAALEQALERT